LAKVKSTGALICAVALGAACRSAPGARDEPSAPQPVPALPADARLQRESDAAAAADVGREKPGLAALQAPGPFVALPVPNFRDAVVSVPLGATEPRPVVVALHGNFDRPEWQCEVWRDITSGFPFVLCPRGVPRTDVPKSLDRWTYGAAQKVEDELVASLEALRAAHGAHVADGPVLFTGFSLGAIVGVRILQRHGARFSRAVLTEGGEKWSHAAAKAYAAAGGQRVLFACGQTACQHAGRSAARILERHGIAARVAFGGNIGHTYDGKVADGIAAEWNWLVESDERWR
jgi:predicted esterase